MTKKILNLEQENAIKAYNEGTPSDRLLLERLYGKEVFHQKITDRVKSFEDACEVLYISTNIPDVSLIREKDRKFIIAQYKLSIITEVLNEDWTPDWDNSNEYKYCPYFEMSNNTLVFGRYDYWSTYSSVSSRLCLRSKELAEYCGKQFIDLYKDLFLI
jgi:hypothetical protein